MSEDQLVRRLKLRELRVLLAVTQSGSMAGAARQLAISQPAVSRAMADMERALGVPLVDRGARGVEPTQYGRALLKRSITIFDELKQGVRDIEFLSDPTAGELRIGNTAGLSEGIVSAVIERLSRQYPRFVFYLVAGGLLAQSEDLRGRRIELGVTRMPAVAPDEDIDVEPLFEEPLVVVAGMQNPWAHRRKIKLAELVREPWTWPTPGTFFESLIIEEFRANGLEPPRATVYVEAPNVRIRLAATGRFLAVVPASMIRPSAKEKDMSLKVLPIELATTRRQVGIITLKNRTLSPLAQRFIACAREVARPLQGAGTKSGPAAISTRAQIGKRARGNV